jgi:hypothetical protein
MDRRARAEDRQRRLSGRAATSADRDGWPKTSTDVVVCGGAATIKRRP